MIKSKREAVLLSPENITPSSTKFEVIGTMNPGVARLSNGDIVLYVRVIEKLKKTDDEKYCYAPRFSGEEKFKITIDKFPKSEIKDFSDLDFTFKDNTKRLTFISHFRRVVLDSSGFKVKSIEQKPSFSGLEWDGELGVEDPRITKIKDLYVMTYVGLSRTGNVSTNLAISNDSKKWYRRGIIFGHQNKDVTIFPELINHKYLAFNRPEGNFNFTSPNIWLSFSQDLTYWGESFALEITHKGKWDSGRVGAGPPPLKTKHGWLFIYHGVINRHIRKEKSISDFLREHFIKEDKEEEFRDIYCAGALLLDLYNPKKIIAKSEKPLILPIRKYEKGTFENKDVFFPTGLILDKNGSDVLIFSGGGDVVTTVKKFSLQEIISSLKKV